MQFLGIQIDAVYHTSIVLSGTEYFFGQGIQMCRAGMSHHGRPMETLTLGQTHLPLDVIEEFLVDLKEKYDLHAQPHKSPSTSLKPRHPSISNTVK